MRGLRTVLPGVIALLLALGAPSHAQAPADTAIHAVSYVEVMPASRGALITLLTQYRDASRKEAGYVRIDLLEQLGRRGFFTVLETWSDQKAFDGHGAAPSVAQFRAGLQPLRLSGYDQRPYKTLSIGAAAAGEGDQAVHVVSHVDIGGQNTDAPGMLTRLAEASRKEPGCLRFDVLQHTMRANHVTVVEVWRNQQAHDAHAAAAHTKQYRDTLLPMTGSPLDERLFRSVG